MANEPGQTVLTILDKIIERIKSIRNEKQVFLFGMIVFFMLFIIACGGSDDSPPVTYNISGAVSGATLAGVTINLTGAATTSATTDASGNFSFTGRANGTYTVTPVKAGHTFNPVSSVVIVSGASVIGTNFVATATGASTYSISGTVAGAVLSGVTITLSGANTGSVATGVGGIYTISGLVPGSYTVTPSLTGFTFSPTSTAVTITVANSTANNFAATAIPVAHSISGTVSGAISSGVTITVTGTATAAATTAADGSYSVTGLYDGNYTVTPSKAGYTFTPTSTAVTVSGAIVINTNFVATINPVPTHSIFGTVSGAVLSGVTITLSSAGSPTTITNGSGNYNLSGIVNGSYTVTPSMAGYTFAPSSRAATVSGGDVTVPNFVSISGADTAAVDAQAVSMAAQILGGGDQTKPALRQALLASGFAIQAPDGSLTQPTQAPSQGMLFTQWDVDVMALGANNGGFVTLSDYAAAIQMAFPELDTSLITANILAGISDSAQSDQPTVRLWARLIVDLGLQAELPYNLLDPNVDPTQVDLSPIQLGLLTQRLLGDVMSLVDGTVTGNPSALNARIGSNAVSTFQLGIPTPLNLAASAPPCTFTDIEQTILDGAAKAETKAFKAFINYLAKKGVDAAGKIGKFLGPVNAVLTYAKLLASLLAFNEDFTADLSQLERTKSTRTGGEQMHITATVKFDNGNAQILNCLRQVGNLAGIDFKLIPTGPIKNAEIKWYLLAGDTNGGSNGSGASLGYLRWAQGSIPNVSRFTDDNGQDTITIEGAPQPKALFNPVQDPEKKPGKVHAKINLKSANIVQDLMSALGGLVSLPVEMVYRTGLGFERSFSFPVIDWIDCGGASNKAGKVVRAASVCTDTWVGTTSSGDGAYGPNLTQASLTLKFNDRITGAAPGQVFYYAEGTVKVSNPGAVGVDCTISPTEVAIDRNTGSNTPGHGDESNQFEVNYGNDPPTAGGAGVVGVTQTVVCPKIPLTYTQRFLYPFYTQGHDVPLSADGQSFGDTHLPFYSFQFTRP